MTPLRRRLRSAALPLLVTSSLSFQARDVAAAEPPVDLGYTSFMDGFGDPRDAGFTYQNYARVYVARRLTDGTGNDVPFHPRLDAISDLSQLIYTFDTPTWTIHPLVHVVVPLVWTHASSDTPPGLSASGFGLGDALLAFAGQFRTFHLPGGVVFSSRPELALQVPIGRYDDQKAVNPGTHTFAFNPSWAATVLYARFELTTRASWLLNFGNGDPGGGLHSTKAGTALYDDFAAAYEVLPFAPERRGALDLRVGVAGYWFQQVGLDRANGAEVPRSRERVVGLGPGAMWTPTGSDTLWLNVYFEMAVENRFAGDTFQLRWAHAL